MLFLSFLFKLYNSAVFYRLIFQVLRTALMIRGGWGGYSHTLPIRVCATQRGRDFEAPDLERGIHFRDVF